MLHRAHVWREDMKTKCEKCGSDFYKYRKCLRFCSRKCSGFTKRRSYDDSYNNEIKERLIKNSEICKNTGCWNWKRYKSPIGRGNLWFKGRTVLVSRVSYSVFNSDIPICLLICHTCDNPSCINPDHLFLGTNADNCRDREMKNRGAKGEKIKKSKLKFLEIEEINKLRKIGLSQQFIADIFLVSQTCISRVLNGRTWRHV